MGSTFSVTIKVANFENFTGWDIHVKTNSSIINPTALTVHPNVIAENVSGSNPIELANCVNGFGTPGTNCSYDPFVGNGFVRSAVANQGNGVASGDGLLFTVSYDVVAAGFSNITILADTISNGSKGGVVHTTISATYGTPVVKPDFFIGANPADLVLTLAVSHNVSQTSTITLTSIDNFTGTANLSAKATLQTTLSAKQVTLPKNGTSTFTITVWANSATTSTQYYVNLTAVIGTKSHSLLITVQVNPAPDFLISVSPSVLEIPATGYGLSAVTIDTQTSFSGQVHLKLDVPSGPVAWLDATDFTISPGQPASTLFNVRTPSSDFPFKYLINITASSPSSTTHTPFTITVKPPKPDFSFQIASPDFVVQAGQSRTFTISTASVNYFKGQIFLLASTLSGINEKFSRQSLALEYGNSSTSLMTVSTDAFLALGFHSINVTALGTTFLGDPVNHSVIINVKIIPATSILTILGLHPLVYFGIVGTLLAGLIGVAVKEIRKPKPKRFLR